MTCTELVGRASQIVPLHLSMKRNTEEVGEEGLIRMFDALPSFHSLTAGPPLSATPTTSHQGMD